MYHLVIKRTKLSNRLLPSKVLIHVHSITMASRRSNASGEGDVDSTQETWSPPGSPLKSPRLSKNYKTGK